MRVWSVTTAQDSPPTPYTDPFADATEPNHLWCADFKGDFQTGDRHRCYPLTLTDAYSRTLLCCGLLRSTKTPRAKR
jgi:transposase InsO family protein